MKIEKKKKKNRINKIEVLNEVVNKTFGVFFRKPLWDFVVLKFFGNWKGKYWENLHQWVMNNHISEPDTTT